MVDGIVEFPDEYWALEDSGDRLGALEFMEREVSISKDPDIYFHLGQEFGLYADHDIQDFQRAFGWFDRGARTGHAPSIYESGIALVKGLGVSEDTMAGIARIREAAILGNEIALSFLMSGQSQSDFEFSITADEVRQFSLILAKRDESNA